MTGRLSSDSDDRMQASTDFGKNLVVEAGAGTGKTSLLVERILNALALGIASIDEIAAITFTKKAAGEMRHRLASGLQRLLSLATGKDTTIDEGQEADRAYRYLIGSNHVSRKELADRTIEAVRGLDRATIDTIHAFCTSLLRVYPVEAGVDPGFEVDSGEHFRILLEDSWESFMADELGRDSGRTDLWRCLLRKLDLADVKNAAQMLAGFGTPSALLVPPFNTVDMGRLFGPEISETIRMLDGVLLQGPELTRESDQKLRSVKAGLELLLREGLEPFRRRADEDRVLKNAIEKNRTYPGKTKGMTSAEGRHLEQTGRKAYGLVRKLYMADETVPRSVLQAVSPFVHRFRRDYLRRGFIDFDGLLALSRDLLRDHQDIRRSVRGRYRLLLVDEFQDTDPLQYEIVLFLGETEGGGATDPFEAELEQGRLFIVGDAKQSIYRFRGADYQAFIRVVDRIKETGGRVLHLRTNFRSVPEILEPVNALFSDGWNSTRYQPAYEMIDPHRPAVGERRVELWQVGDGSGLRAGQRRLLEGRIIADQIAMLDPEYSRIAVLLRAFSDLALYLRPLRDLGIPYIVDGGRGFMERQEVNHLLAALRAVVRPADQAALLAVLRSPAFGVSDLDLARLAAAGGEWDFRLELPEFSPESVKDAYHDLNEMSKKIGTMPADETVHYILEKTGLECLDGSTFEGAQRVANLRKLARTAAGMVRDGKFSLNEVLDHLEGQTVSEVESESPLADERANAVRIMTIHKAKGLEFDTVMIPDLARSEYHREADRARLIKTPDGSALAIKVGGTPNLAAAWFDMEDRKHDTAESLRLLYVAMTRARERLILVNSDPGNDKAPWLAALKPWMDSAESQGVLIRSMEPSFERRKVPHPAPYGKLQAVEAMDRATETARYLSGKPFDTPSGMKEEPRLERHDDSPGRKVAREAGTVVHRALEIWEGEKDESLMELAGRMADGEVREESVAILRTFLDSSLFTLLLRLEIVGKELPVLLHRKDGSTYRGSIDLVYRDSDGNLVVADYKTDDTDDPDSLAERYRDQLLIYAEVVRGAYGLERLPSGELWHLRSATRIPIPW